MNDGFFRLGAATPRIQVANCVYNAASIDALIQEAAEKGVQAIVFPELCITGYTCGDLFLNRTLQQGAEQALVWLMQETRKLELLIAVGLPVPLGAAVYNCAAVFCKGKLLGLVPKTSLPNYNEFYEARWFAAAPEGQTAQPVFYAGQQTLFGAGQLFLCAAVPGLTIGVEVCEDLWVPQPPSVCMARAGATVMLNLSASDEVVGKASYRRSLVAGQSARLFCAYAYADAGEGESTTDLVFAGHNVIAENGMILSESRVFSTGVITADVDLERVIQERRRSTTWREGEAVQPVSFELKAAKLELERKIEMLPFVPNDTGDLDSRCDIILQLQAAGLQKRLAHTGAGSVVLGISGGLDSTLALLVTVHAFDLLKLDRRGILAVSMPGFGTTQRTKSNAQRLAELSGAEYREIPIGASVLQHFHDIGHNPGNHDVTYENAQARERTQVLMDLANQVGGLVIGTGDLSELALGWATYNGDHMSMYAVNSSVPKTLVRYLVAYAARGEQGELASVLLDVLNTPVSPELLPPENGEIAQKTENIVGPYELHDFFLYYLLRFGFGPGKIYRMASHAFAGKYDGNTIKHWLHVFFQRFFTQQFKRSCLPDGPKIGSVALSPRGDWRMPSDASAALWMTEIEAL